MGKRLVITEKPSVARDIVAALGGFKDADGYWEGNDLVVTFAVGHLLELQEPEDLDPKYKRWTFETLPILPEGFHFPMKPKAEQKDRLKLIKKLLEREDVVGVVNACDAGREGELIFREILEFHEIQKPVERLWLQSMTKDAIRNGFAHLQAGKKYEALSAAAHGRSFSDWVIGMNASRALSIRLRSRMDRNWSAGRVQTPTLAMLVDREIEVLEHVPVDFWRIKGRFEHHGEVYAAAWFDPSFKDQVTSTEEEEEGRDDRIFDEARAKAIVARLAGKPAFASETRKPSKEAAPPLFDLTSLQREGNRRYGWSARRTLNAAQRCYEAHKVLTYPRTDSKALPNDYRGVVDGIFDALAVDPRFKGAVGRLRHNGLENTQRIFDDTQVSDHFAIVPTGLVVPLEGDDAKLFDLVARRFLAAFHPPAVWSRVERTTEVDGELFRSRSKVLQDPGWREVMGEVEGQGSEKLSPLVPGRDDAKGIGVTPRGYEVEADQTKPPPRISEARLLSLMEHAGRQVDDEATAAAMKESGIGTPATRADIIENLISKSYVIRTGRILRPSVKGIRLIDMLRRMKNQRLASPALTGELERHLADLEKGKNTLQAFMEEIYEYTREVVDLTRSFEYAEIFPSDKPLGPCPLCAKPVYERSFFYRCQEPEGLFDKARQEEVAATDCPFRIWKDKSGRFVDRRSVEEILRDGKTRALDGFTTNPERPPVRTFRGVLELLPDGKLELKRLEGGEGGDEPEAPPAYEINTDPLGECPVCHAASVMETAGSYVCANALAVLQKLGRDPTSLRRVAKKDIPEGMAYCSFALPRTVCRREITRGEATAYVANGRTEPLTDFVSRFGKPFSATLVLKDNGTHEFEFAPRPGKDGEAPAKKAPARKVASKTKKAKSETATKTPRKKAVAKKKVAEAKPEGTKKAPRKRRADAAEATV